MKDAALAKILVFTELLLKRGLSETSKLFEICLICFKMKNEEVLGQILTFIQEFLKMEQK